MSEKPSTRKHRGIRERLAHHLRPRSPAPKVADTSAQPIANPNPQTITEPTASKIVTDTSNQNRPTVASVWEEAWNIIEQQEPKLLKKYESFLAQSTSNSGDFEKLSGQQKKDRLLQIADTKITAVKARLDGQSLGQRLLHHLTQTIDVVIKVKDFITSVASNEPHAALVWAGCCVVLPLILNAKTERETAIEGLEATTRILGRYAVVQSNVFGGSAHGPLSKAEVLSLQDQLRRYLIQLYSNIIKYQILLVHRFDSNAFTRFFKGALKLDDWEKLLKDISELENSNFKDVNILSNHAQNHIMQLIESSGTQLSTGFVEIRSKLDGIQSDITELKRRNSVQLTKDEQRRYVNIFNGTVDYELQRNRNNQCVSGSGKWFFEHDRYEQFMTAKGSQLLFVTAEAGGGKSTTLRTLIDQLRDSAEPPLVAFFFFKDDAASLRSYEEAMNSLVYQLLVQDSKLIPHVKSLCDQFGEGLKHNTKELWNALSQVAMNTQQHIVCILDAIDECEEAGRKQLVKDLRAFFESHTNTALKVVASSRPYQDRHHPYKDITSPPIRNIRHLEGEDAVVTSDIEKVVRASSEDLAERKQLDSGVRDLLMGEVIAQNQQTRSFLAIRMAFALLEYDSELSSSAGKRTISKILAKIPQNLGDQFDAMLSKSDDQQHTRNILCVVLESRRTIKVDELKVIYALTEPSNPVNDAPKTYDDLEVLRMDDEAFKKLIRAKCGLFITFVGTAVHLFHQTAREHLICAEGISPLVPQTTQKSSNIERRIWKNSISLVEANFVCAELCLKVLNLDVPATIPWGPFEALLNPSAIWRMEDIRLLTAKPFLVYAGLNWYEHYVLVGSIGSQLFETGYTDVLDLSKPVFWCWFFIACYSLDNFRGREMEMHNSNIWTKIGIMLDHSLFLKEQCIGKMKIPMCHRLSILFNEFLDSGSSHVDEGSKVFWRVENGFHLIDQFHAACGDYKIISSIQEAKAIEAGDTDRAAVLHESSPHSLVWASIQIGAPKALQQALLSTNDLEWLQDTPEYLVHQDDKWNGRKTSRKSFEKSRLKDWEHSYPPSFVFFFVATNTHSCRKLFEVLADWVERTATGSDWACQIWEAGGFIIPSLATRLVALGAPIDRELWKDRRTALQIAATFWAHDTIKALLELGADATTCTLNNGYNALHWFSNYERLHLGEPWPETYWYGLEPDIFRHHYLKNSIASSIRALIAASAHSGRHDLLNQGCNNGQTPLMCAAQSFRVSSIAVKTLLDAGASANAQDSRMETSLMKFFRNATFTDGSASVVRNLLRYGADSEATDDEGFAALGYWAGRVMTTPLGYLDAGINIYNQSFNALANLGTLSKTDLLVRQLKSLHLPLAIAARLGNTKLCAALLDAGADPNECHFPKTSIPFRLGDDDFDGEEMQGMNWNPVMIALYGGAYTTAILLMERGASVLYRAKTKKKSRYDWEYLINGATHLHILLARSQESWWEHRLALIGDRFYGCCFRRPVKKITDSLKLLNRERPGRPGSADELLHTAERQRNEVELDSSEEGPESEYEKVRWKDSSSRKSTAEFAPYDTAASLMPSYQFRDDPLINIIVDRNLPITQRREALIRYMLLKQTPVNARTEELISPLIFAIEAGMTGAVKILLEHGADPNIWTSYGRTPLIIAAQLGNLDIIEHLLKAQAIVDAQMSTLPPSECGCCAFVEYSKFNSTFQHCRVPFTALAVAAAGGHVKVVERLIEAGADPNIKMIHHAHGLLPKKRAASTLDSGLESDQGAPQWKGFIGVSTALTFATDECRQILLRIGAIPGDTYRECDCKVEPHRIKEDEDDDSDEDYESDADERPSPNEDKDRKTDDSAARYKQLTPEFKFY